MGKVPAFAAPITRCPSVWFDKFIGTEFNKKIEHYAKRDCIGNYGVCAADDDGAAECV